MKNYSKKITMILLVFCSIFISTTFYSSLTAEAAKVKLSKESVTIARGKSITLKLKGTKKKVKWSTNNKKVATVTQKGKVTGKKVGTAKIVARVGEKKYVCKVQVVKTVNDIPVVLNKDNCQYYVRDGEVTVTNYDYDKEWTSIIIPKKIDGHPVKTIYGFGNHKKLIELIISDGITALEGCPFNDCSNLKKLVIPNSVTKIEGRTPGYSIDGYEIHYVDTIIRGTYLSAMSGCPKLTIYGYTGSFAEEFANKECIPFKVIKE